MFEADRSLAAILRLLSKKCLISMKLENKIMKKGTNVRNIMATRSLARDADEDPMHVVAVAVITK